MAETINVEFDANSLPAWARNNPAVVRQCKINLSFRHDVHNAKTAQMRRFLIKEAQRLTRR